MSGRIRQSFFSSVLLMMTCYRTATMAMTVANKATSRISHFHCYLLRSLDPNHPRKTYVGFTVRE